MKGQGDGKGKRVEEDGCSRRHVEVIRLPELTDGNERDTDRLKSL